jgi:hypothetical protein
MSQVVEHGGIERTSVDDSPFFITAEVKSR